MPNPKQIEQSIWTSQFIGSSLVMIFWQSPLFQISVWGRAGELFHYFLAVNALSQQRRWNQSWYHKTYGEEDTTKKNSVLELQYRPTAGQSIGPAPGGEQTEHLRPAKTISAHLWKVKPVAGRSEQAIDNKAGEGCLPWKQTKGEGNTSGFWWQRRANELHLYYWGNSEFI